MLKVQRLYTKLHGINGRNFPSVLVANKSDIGATRKVKVEDGKTLAKLWGIPYLEVSAKRHTTDIVCKLRIIKMFLCSFYPPNSAYLRVYLKRSI